MGGEVRFPLLWQKDCRRRGRGWFFFTRVDRLFVRGLGEQHRAIDHRHFVGLHGRRNDKIAHEDFERGGDGDGDERADNPAAAPCAHNEQDKQGEKGQVIITAAGSANKNRKAFEEDFGRMLDRLGAK